MDNELMLVDQDKNFDKQVGDTVRIGDYLYRLTSMEKVRAAWTVRTY
ncbi:MAG: hypothetical protein GTO14_09865 [Anaerolineales bacterium]|nr:hypothetical protein [Anaerolineales bacterium]